MNFLESLASEWYAIQGYFVRTNIKANRRSNGGYNNEIDVLAFLPATGKLVHLETSWDALTWEKREQRYLENLSSVYGCVCPEEGEFEVFGPVM